MNKSYDFIVCSLCILMSSIAWSQSPEFFGAGNDSSITISASSFLSDTIWPMNPSPDNLINGDGLDQIYYDASRFLTQASLGYDQEDIEAVVAMGYEAWIDSQFTLAPEYLLPRMDSIHAIVIDTFIANGGDSSDIPRRPDYIDFNYAWWDINMKNDDLLRHRVATALSEIFVISRRSLLSRYGDGLSNYYDLMLDGAFGNYEDLLYDISINPMMAWHLTHLNNPKSDSINMTYPDENYAREIMQLFSIGLFELNIDGSYVIVDSAEVPTYDNDDIVEFSKIFTGLSFSARYKSNSNPYWNMNIYHADVTVPMKMYEEQHEPGVKYLLNDTIIPAGQTGLEDVEDAINCLFNHQNVGPFISYRLIQRLVKSNPSPAYISRVAAKFNDNGNGVRGDMKAVVKAILLDEEARNCSYQLDGQNGKLKEPLLRYTQFTRAIDKFRPADDYMYNNSGYFFTYVQQDIMAAPSVFNFFLPNDAPNGEIKDAGLVAPEFQIHNTETSVGFWNRVDRWTKTNSLLMTNAEVKFDERYVKWDRDEFYPHLEDYEVYINWLDLTLCAGRMSQNTRTIIRNAIARVSGSNQETDRLWMGAYLTLISPDFAVTR